MTTRNTTLFSGVEKMFAFLVATVGQFVKYFIKHQFKKINVLFKFVANLLRFKIKT